MSPRIKVLGLLAAGLAAAGMWFYGGFLPGHGGLSASEVFAIRRAIRQQTAEPIVTIRGDGVGAAMATTGRRGSGLDGALLEYYLLRTTRGWEITGRSAWMSMGPTSATHRMNGTRVSLQFGPHGRPLIGDLDR